MFNVRRGQRAGVAIMSAWVGMTTAAACGGSDQDEDRSASATTAPPNAGPSAPAISASLPTAGATTPSTTSASTVAVERVQLAGHREVETGGGPAILAATDDTLWIELHRASHLAGLDPETMTVELLTDVPAHCGISTVNGVVWTTIHRQSLVTRTDAETGATALIEIPHACGLAATNDAVWISDPNDGLVHRLDPQTGDLLDTINVPEAPTNLSLVGDMLFVTGEGSGGWLDVVDVATGEVVHSHAWPQIAHFDSVVPGFGAVWAAGRGDPRLFELDAVTGDVIGTTEIGGNPSGIAVGEHELWITLLKGDLLRFDPSTDQVTAVFSSEYTWLASPVLAFGSLWMTSLEENVVIRVDPATLTGDISASVAPSP